jgi:hypothetical protein
MVSSASVLLTRTNRVLRTPIAAKHQVGVINVMSDINNNATDKRDVYARGPNNHSNRKRQRRQLADALAYLVTLRILADQCNEQKTVQGN